MKKTLILSAAQTNRLKSGGISVCSIIPRKYIINDDPGRYICHGVNDEGAALFEDVRPEITPWITPIPPPYKPGSAVIIREAMHINIIVQNQPVDSYYGEWEDVTQYVGDPYYAADHKKPVMAHTIPACRMRPKYARFNPVVMGVECRRLQSITNEYAISMGASWTDNGPVNWAKHLTFEQANPISGWKRGWSFTGHTHPDMCLGSARSAFGNYWESRYGQTCWDRNYFIFITKLKLI